LILILCGSSWAKESSLGVKGAMPASTKLVPMTASATSAQTAAPKAKDIARDPAALVTFLKKNPHRMNVETMNPALVLTMSELLLDGQAWLVSETLLYQAVKKWPDRADLKRAYARVLIQLGRPDYAVRIIEEMNDSQDAEAHFLRALGLVRSKPKSDAKSKAALDAFRAVLRARPDYMDKSGWTAKDVQTQIDRMMGVAPPRSPHP
tara:strand:+ start:224 stop:844 length:621 start_codon:yes stop_codon:yes gene_type:complete